MKSRTHMKPSFIIMSAATALISIASLRGADFDGSRPIICAVNQVVVCPRTGEVEKETPEAVNLPQFFFIDVPKKLVTSKGPSGDVRQTTIEVVKHESGTLILSGVQLGKAWNAVINETSGKTTITGATADTAFVVFAACMVNPEAGIAEAAGAKSDSKRE